MTRSSTVLFLAANPLRLPQLQLGEECRAIEDKIRGAKFRDQIRFRSRWAARPDDLLQGLNEDAPSVLHFSGHGDGDQGVCFQANDGSAVRISADGLAQVMRAAGTGVKVVVLNACYSRVQAQALVALVPCVVGVSGAMGDQAAIVYAASFYRALAFGMSVANAHQQGLAALALQPVGERVRDIQLEGAEPTPLTPELLTRPDFDANRVYIVQASSACAVDADDGPVQRGDRSGTSSTDTLNSRAIDLHPWEPCNGAAGLSAQMEGRRLQRRSTVKTTEGEPLFTGRDDELGAIEDRFRARRIVVLHGAPGLGKTRLAKEYAHKHVEAYPGGMYFLSFERSPPIELAKLLRAMGKPAYAGESVEDQCRRALHELGGAGRTLLIYDAVADEPTLREWLPYGGLEWHLIVTSTFAHWTASWSTVEVGALREHAARTLVSTILGGEARAARLAAPITARAAGITIELCATAAAAHEQLRRGRAADGLTEGLAKETIASFEAAWTRLSRPAQIVLGVASAFVMPHVPAPVILSTLQRVGWSASAVEAAIDEARARSLVAGNAANVDIHPLVARFVRNRAPLVERKFQQLDRELSGAAGPVFEYQGALDPPRQVALARQSPAAHPDTSVGALAAHSEPPIEPPSVSPPVPRAATAMPRSKRRHRVAAWGGVALAPIAALAVYLTYGPGPPTMLASFAELKTRPYDVRFACADAAAYLPIREHMRGASGLASESIPYAVLNAFQKYHDDYAFAIARALNGAKLADVVAELRALPQTPSIRSDRIAIELLTTSNDNVEPILAELESLQTSDDPAVARAARWNYALLLSRLDLPLSAAHAFQVIADDGEPGWADEARTRAAPPARRARDFQARFDHAREAGEALVDAGTPVPIELVKAYPGLLRGYLYDAVRTAPSRERVLALGAMAVEIDQLGGPQEPHVLSDYVARVAKLDFRRRAPLAGAYARLLQGAKLTADDERALTTSSASSDVFDIVMGAMDTLQVTPAHVDAFRTMTKRTGDPWFEVVLARAEATAAAQHSNWSGAEARLRNAENLCSSAVAYRRLSVECLALGYQLGKLYEDLHRIPESLKALRTEVRNARIMGDWSQYLVTLWRLAVVERFNSSTVTARAYTNEILRLVDNPDSKLWGRLPSGAAALDVDGRAVRRNFTALHYGAPDPGASNLLSGTYHRDAQSGDLAQLQALLRDIQGGANTTAADRVVADETEGRLLIERDSPAARVLLERVIAAADALPSEVIADKVRADAYSVLAFEAARHDDFARVLTLIARELGRSSPATCTVGMVAGDERAVAVVRGADGRDRGAYDAKRNSHSALWAVAEALAQGLNTCPHVQVMALGSLQEQPHVLPAALPWSYVTSARGRLRTPIRESTEPRALVIAAATPPPYLQLQPLSARPPDSDPSTIMLSGPEATPAQVLAEMVDASEIQFHTHALIDVGVSAASHLVLSPQADGSYALTTESIRGIELHGRPIVALAASHSAQTAHYQKARSLPDAFLAAGARAVFAAATDVPDRDAGPFFSRVLARVRSGADPAVALRDERMAALALNPSSWVADVILFE